MNGPEAEVETNKRRRRRPPRRTKQNPAAHPGGGFVSADGIVGQPLEWVEDGGGPRAGLAKPFNSLPNMCVGNGLMGPAPPVASKSCPLPASPSPALSRLPPSTVKKKLFASYWSERTVEDAVEKGEAYAATFHVNAHNRLEAYCTIDGLPVDVLISGVLAQNRAVEGDVVAVVLDPVAFWTKIKGPNMPGNVVDVDDSYMLPEVREVVGNYRVKKEEVDADTGCHSSGTDVFAMDSRNGSVESTIACGVAHFGPENGPGTSGHKCNGHNYTILESSNVDDASEQGKAVRALERICAILNSYPSKRPTGKVVAIIKKSPRRGAVVGFLDVNQQLPEEGEMCGKPNGALSKKSKNTVSLPDKSYIQLIPTDSKFPKMVVNFSSLPNCIKERVNDGDQTVEMELIAARIDEWNEETLYPWADVVCLLGRGGEIEPWIAAIMFQNALSAAGFSSESLACLPEVPWKVPVEEIKSRKDLRNICTFTVDPPTAIDLDDAVSVEILSDEIYRIGVHIADVSYFVIPDTALDVEARVRSTSVYILQHKLPMLPARLSEELGSLIPGEDRLAFSIIWDVDRSGNIIDRWIGRSVIKSCCKLSYEFVQNIIDGSFEADQLNHSESSSPQLYGHFEWKDVIKSLRSLYEISMKLREIRFKDGALHLDNSKLVFLFDECGTPCDSFLVERMESCYVVEELMLLANRSAAEVISRTFPECALLRRHPEPNLRKLKEFEAFCSKHGFELDASSSGQLHLSLSRIRQMLKNDPVLFDILVSYASKPMQSAAYFSTGDLRGMEGDWAHYALSVPFYTHFTSPLRRYPDIIVHRTLLAALDAEETYSKKRTLPTDTEDQAPCNGPTSKCFTGLCFDKDVAESEEGREALSASASKFRVPGTEILAEVASYCNERKLASSHAEEAGKKLYLWALLKKRQILVSEARVLGLGPRFISIYIHMLAIERRIYYGDVEDLSVEWFDTTGTLVLDLLRMKRSRARRSPGELRSIEDVVLLMDPSEVFVLEVDNEATEGDSATAGLSPPGLAVKNRTEPAIFPLVLKPLSSVPVVLHAVGGDNGPFDIGVRLYMCSYFS